MSTRLSVVVGIVTAAIVTLLILLLQLDREPAGVPAPQLSGLDSAEQRPPTAPSPAAHLLPLGPPSMARLPDGASSAPQSAVSPDRTVQLSGRVLLPDGSGAGGARVEAGATPFHLEPGALLLDLSNVAGTAEEDGRFVLSLPDAADKLIMVEAHKEGYAGASVFVFGPATEMPVPDEMRRTRGLELRLSTEALIEGILVYADGSPAAAHEMHYTQMQQHGTTMGYVTSRGEGVLTDADGQFRLRGLAEGPVTIAALREGVTIHAWEEQAPNEALVLTVPDAGHRVAGRVYRRGSGFPVEGAEIALISQLAAHDMPVLRGRGATRAESAVHQAVSGSGGRFVFEGLRPGSYAVHARHKGERLGLHRVELAERNVPKPGGLTVIEVPESTRTISMDIRLYEGDRFRGRAVEAETNKPVGGVLVEVTAHGHGAKDVFGDPLPRYNAVADDNGRFTIPRVFHSGRIMVEAQAPGYTLNAAEVDGRQAGRSLGAQQGALTVWLPAEDSATEREMVLTFGTQLTVSGIVRHEDGRPVADARVAFLGGPQDSSMFVSSHDAKWHDVNHKGEFVIPVSSGSLGTVLARTGTVRNLRSELVTVDDRPVEGVELIVRAPARISGRVVDGEGRALPRAMVSLDSSMQAGYGMFHAADSDMALSDADGRFRFENLSAGRYSIQAMMEGRVPSETAWLEMSAGQERSGIELVLAGGGELRLRVVDTEGKPVAGALVHLSLTGGATLNTRYSGLPVTDAQGRYSWSPVPREPIALNISADGYEHKHISHFTAGPGEHEIVIEPRTSYVLMVHVVDAATDASISGFSVRSTYSHQNIALQQQPEVRDGMFVDHSLTRYMMVDYTVSHSDYATATLQIHVGEHSHQMETRIRLHRGSEVGGRVVGRETLEPLAGIRVEYHRGESITHGMNAPPVATARTGEDGRFAFPRMTAGRAIIQVVPPAPYTARREPVTPDGTSPLDVGDIAIGKGGTLRVTVQCSGLPVAGEFVRLQGYVRGTAFERSGVTDAQGSYTFSNLPSASYSVFAASTSVHGQQVRDGDVREVTILLGSASLEIELRYRGGPASVLGSYNLDLYGTVRGNSFHRGDQSTTAGVHKYQDLPAGTYAVVLQLTSGMYWLFLNDIASYTLSEGERRREVLDLPGGEIHGRIVDAEGEPVRGASLVHRPLGVQHDQSHLYKIPGEAGEFAANLLSPGRHWFRAMHPELGSAEVTVELGRDEVIEDLRLVLGEQPTGTLVAIVLRLSDGQPVENAHCRIRDEDGRDYTAMGFSRPDYEGALTIENLPPGTYSAVVSAWGYSTGHHTVTIEAGQTTYIHDVLYEAGSMRWTLATTDGAPIAGAETRLVPVDPGSIETVRTGRTNEGGHWDEGGLYPGQYRAEATLPDGLTLTQPFTVIAHEQTEERTTR